MDISTIFSGFKFAQSSLCFFGLTESLGIQMGKLVHSKLNAAMRELKHAENSEVEGAKDECKDALRSSRRLFSEAISLESSERLAIAYIGLAFCHKNLDQLQSCKMTLIEFAKYNFNYFDFLPIYAKVLLYKGSWRRAVMAGIVCQEEFNRYRHIREIQAQAKEYAELL